MDKLKLVEDINSLLEKVQPLFEISAALEEIGSLDQAKSDALAAKEKAYKELEDVKSNYDSKVAELVDADSKLVSSSMQLKAVQESEQALRKDIQDRCAALQAEEEAKIEEFRARARDEVLKQMKILEINKKAIEDSRKELKESQDQVLEMKSKLAAFIKG